MNFQLRLTVDRARAVNMPNDNIDRAIKTGTGELKGDQTKEVTYEGFGPGGVALMILAVTNNTNRTAGEIRAILSKHGGSLGGQNSVAWMFRRSGVIRIPLDSLAVTPAELELGAIDAGATDVYEEEGQLVIVAAPEKLQALQAWLATQNVKPERAGLEYVAATTTAINDAVREKLYAVFDALEDSDDVTDFFSNDV